MSSYAEALREVSGIVVKFILLCLVILMQCV
jgi:hypothetical protein